MITDVANAAAHTCSYLEFCMKFITFQLAPLLLIVSLPFPASN